MSGGGLHARVTATPSTDMEMFCGGRVGAANRYIVHVSYYVACFVITEITCSEFVHVSRECQIPNADGYLEVVSCAYL